MKTLLRLLECFTEALHAIAGLTRYVGMFVVALFSPNVVLAARVVALQSQLAACCGRIDQKKAPRPKFTQDFRLLWIILSKTMRGWEDLAHLMRPATVVKWHRTAYRMFWRWKWGPGRPPISAEIQALIRRLSRENPIWSADRIHDTLAQLGYTPPDADTIRKYMVRPRKPRRPSTTWLPFLRNHLDVSWAIDLFTVVTLNFRTL